MPQQSDRRNVVQEYCVKCQKLWLDCTRKPCVDVFLCGLSYLISVRLNVDF